jgi:hypothetical protein
MAGVSIPDAVNIPTPIIIDGLPLSSADDVIWELRPGLAPAIAEFTRKREVVEQWLANTDGRFVNMEFDGRIFKKLRILRPIQIDPWHVTVRVGDRRVRWKNARIFGRFNLRREVNDVLRIVDLLRDVDAVELSEQTKKDNLEAIQKQRYRQWSIRTNGEVYTAKTLAILCMKALLIELEEDAGDFDEEGANACPDNGDVPDLQEFIGAKVEESIGPLLQRAELQTTVDEDGKIRFYDPYAKPTFPRIDVKAGAYRVPDLSRIQPSEIECVALVERDRRIVWERTPTQETAPPDKLKPSSDPATRLLCRNVLKLPLDTTIYGIVYKIGTWVPIEDALAGWGIPEADVRALWFFGGEGLKYKYARRISTLGKVYYDPSWLRRVQSILSCYRQTFQLDKSLLDMVRSWNTETVSIIDPVSHKRQPTPVFMQWYDLFPASPLIAKNGPVDKCGENLSSFTDKVDGFERSLLPASYEAAPASATMENPVDIGIFRITMLQSIDGAVAERIPSNVDNELNIFDPGVRQQLQFTTKNMRLSSGFRLEVIISTIEGAPNSDEDDPVRAKKLFYRKKFVGFEKGGGGKVTIFVRQDTARIDENGNMVNGDQMDAIMSAEATACRRSYDDRPVGTPTFPHDAADDWKLRGHLRAIRFIRSKNGATSVIVDATEPEVQINPIRYMPQSVRQFLQRAIPKDY